jgi:hypothetical protein
MTLLKTIAGAILGAVLILLLARLVPLTPDLSDWGGKAFPRSYLTPLILLGVISYVAAWVGAQLCPETGRLSGMLSAILAGAVAIGWHFQTPMLEPLFHHPAYPMFSDHALLALAILLVAGHLGGLRIERAFVNRIAGKPFEPPAPLSGVP